MPKTYEYNGDKYPAEILVGLMDEPIIDMTAAEVDQIVKTRDAGAAKALAAYRDKLGLARG